MASKLWTPKLTSEKSAEIGKAFFDAIESVNIAEVGKILAPDAEIWHNTDGVVVKPETTLRTLKGMHKFVANVKYMDRKLRSWPGGFVEQHILTGSRKADGEKVRLFACIVCEVNGNGQITRLDEYFDSSAQNMFAKVPRRTKL